MTEIRLPPDQLEELADLIADRLSADADQPARLVGPRELAAQIGKSPEWCRQHVAELGGWRDGDGERPRYVFEVELALERLRALGGGKTSKPEPRPAPRRRRRRTSDVPLLDVKGAK